MRIHKAGTPYQFGVLDLIIISLVIAAAGYVVYKIRIDLVYHWNWELIPQYFFRFDADEQAWTPNLLTFGFLNTIRLSLWAMLFGTVIGLLAGLCRMSSRLFNRLIGASYVELIRNLPPLVLIFIFYYFVGDQILTFFGVDSFIRSQSPDVKNALEFLVAPVPLFPAFVSAIITLSLFEGAYIAEIFRAGVQAVDTGQWEGASALGFSRYQRMRYVILPQAVKNILPPLAGQFISTIKDSAIVSVISIQELTFQGMEIMASSRLTFEVWITITLLYYCLTQTLSLATGFIEKSLRRKGPANILSFH